MDDSENIRDDVIESQDKCTHFNERKAISKTQSFYISLAFLLITIACFISKFYTDSVN